MKKVFSLLLALVLVFGLMTVSNAEIDNTLYLASKVSGNGDRIASVWSNVYFTGSLLYRTLFLAEADMTTLKADLASGYTVSEDGLVYTIDWVGGKWSDGEEITLDDVVFSIGANLRASASNAIFTNAFVCLPSF